MTPEAFEDVHSFIQFSMLVQEKMGARFTEEDLENEIKKGETYLGIKFQEDEYNALKRRLESRFKIKLSQVSSTIIMMTSLIGIAILPLKMSSFGSVIGSI